MIKDKSKLTAKKIRDKTGKATTVWVRAYEDSSTDKKSSSVMSAIKNATKTVESYHKGASDKEKKDAVVKILEKKAASTSKPDLKKEFQAAITAIASGVKNKKESAQKKEGKEEGYEALSSPLKAYEKEHGTVNGKSELALVNTETGEVLGRGYTPYMIDHLMINKKLDKNTKIKVVADSEVDDKGTRIEDSGGQFNDKFKATSKKEASKKEEKKFEHLQEFVALAKKHPTVEGFKKEVRKNTSTPKEAQDAFGKKYGHLPLDKAVRQFLTDVNGEGKTDAKVVRPKPQKQEAKLIGNLELVVGKEMKPLDDKDKKALESLIDDMADEMPETAADLDEADGDIAREKAFYKKHNDDIYNAKAMLDALKQGIFQEYSANTEIIERATKLTGELVDKYHEGYDPAQTEMDLKDDKKPRKIAEPFSPERRALRSKYDKDDEGMEWNKYLSKYSKQ